MGLRMSALGRPATYRAPGETAPITIPAVVMTVPSEEARHRDNAGGFELTDARELSARWSKATGIVPRKDGTLERDGMRFRIVAIDRDDLEPEWRVTVERL